MEEVLTEKVEKTTHANSMVSRLKPAEVEIIHFFVQFARALGQPRSVAEIYGVLFTSEVPLPMETLIERLNLSKGSASQGLKYLQDLGAVRSIYAAADRRTHYEAVAELRRPAGRFLRQQILIHFEDSEVRLNRITPSVNTLQANTANILRNGLGCCDVGNGPDAAYCRLY
ncbi:MAG: hypothetical protein ABSF34_00270 [Verrucomicrobiota bacterium]